MHLVIISGAARPQLKSNTAKIIAAFGQGYEECGNTTEVYYLSDRRQWEKAQKGFQDNTNILIALPLYVENIPGFCWNFCPDYSRRKRPVLIWHSFFKAVSLRQVRAVAARHFWKRCLHSSDASMPER